MSSGGSSSGADKRREDCRHFTPILPRSNKTLKTIQLATHLGTRSITLTEGGGQKQECWVNPEYGPAPYMPALPHSLEPVADLAEVVEAFKQRLEKAYAEI